MEMERLLELAGVVMEEGQKPEDYSLVDKGKTWEVKYKGQILASFPDDVWVKLFRDWKGGNRKRMIPEAEGESKMSTGMTGDEFDFEMEPEYITILRHNKDTGITIPIDNWDKMVRAYNRIINKKHNY